MIGRSTWGVTVGKWLVIGKVVVALDAVRVTGNAVDSSKIKEPRPPMFMYDSRNEELILVDDENVTFTKTP